MAKTAGEVFKEIAAPAPWEVPPLPIPVEQIKEVITANVVIVGAGMAGMCAAVSAAQASAKCVLLEKGPTYMAHGAYNGAVGSKLQKKLGIEIDKEELIAQLMRWAGEKADRRLVRLWADKSGEAMDWLLDMAEAAGQCAARVDTDILSGKDEFYREYPTAHLFPGMQAGLMKLLEHNAKTIGVDIRYETPAARLVKEEKRRVSGVIAETSKDKYTLFKASNGVILCTGGYSHNPEMVAKYCPWALGIDNWYRPPRDTGDGHRMGLWVGAAMDRIPHCTMIHPGFNPAGFPLNVRVPLMAVPFLNVNIFGERFMNEDVPMPYLSNVQLSQPGKVYWQVWDEKWREDASKMGRTLGRLREKPEEAARAIETAAAIGAVLKISSLEELAQKMEVPYKAFKATIDRNNQLARMGKDLDFGKMPSRLTTIEKPPFYAVKRQPQILVTLSGLKINTRMEVIDPEWKVIPGLYAAGNVSGGFFAECYPFMAAGLSHGRALTSGRLAGLNAAASLG
jgi:fumarate reductase flavoprotein subunit